MVNKSTVEKLSLWQLFILIVTFQIGSAAVVGIGNEAKQDAWIAVFLASLLGVVMTGLYAYMLSKVPGKNLFEIFTFCYGKWLGKIITFIYVIYFFYTGTRVLRDFCELISSFILENTPSEVIAITMMMTIIYMIYLGIEVVGRTNEIFIPYVFSFSIFIGFAILSSGEIEFAKLQPIMGEGVKPIMKAVFPALATFPFGEMIAFSLVIPYVSKLQKTGKVSMVAVFISGLILVYNSVTQITTLGADMKNRSSFPLLSAAREISLMNFIERVDLIIVFIVMFGIMIKVTIYFYSGLKGLQLIVNRPYRTMVFSMGSLIAFFSINISHNFAEHIQEGLVFSPFYMHIPLQYIIPIMTLPIFIWKLKRKQKEKNT